MKTFCGDPVLVMLLGSTFVFTGLTIWVTLHTPGDGQTFQLLAGLTTGFGGAVLARVKPQTKEEEKPPGASLTETKTTVLKDPDPLSNKAAQEPKGSE